MSRSPITAETTPEVNKPTAPMARMPATIFRLTFSANAEEIKNNNLDTKFIIPANF